MNSMRKVLYVLAVMALAAFALPSVAGDNGKKLYSLGIATVSTSPDATPPYLTLQATLTNNGKSNISSFSFSVAGLMVFGVDQPASGHASYTASSVSVTNMHPLKSPDSFTVTFRVSNCGDNVSWSPKVWTGSSLNGQNFDPVSIPSSVSCGSLAAGALFTVVDSTNPDCVTGQRGYYDKDGSIPNGSLQYFVTNMLAASNDLHFRWPDFQAGGDPLATFEYTICAPGSVPPAPNTQVAWLNTDGSPASTPGTPAFIPAEACLAPDVLPAPYGSLMGNVGTSDTWITVDTSTPAPQLTPGVPPGSIALPALPFDIVIANAVTGTERMTVTGITCADNGNDDSAPDPVECGEREGGLPIIWFVTRAVGGTALASHTANALVMSTPLPLLPSTITCYDSFGNPLPSASCRYVPLNQALMCVAVPALNEVGGHATKFIDIGGDGWGSQP